MGIPSREQWEEYERHKRELVAQDMEPDEYEQACRELLEELGL